MLRIRAAVSHDIQAWHTLRRALWPEIDDPGKDARECEAMLADGRFGVFVAERDGELAGFVEARLRPYADGCETSPVGFIEGWYVVPEQRRRGIGRSLVAAAERWARSKGCTEMASDALLENADSHRAHERLGYAEVEKRVAFRKDLRV